MDKIAKKAKKHVLKALEMQWHNQKILMCQQTEAFYKSVYAKQEYSTVVHVISEIELEKMKSRGAAILIAQNPKRNGKGDKKTMY